MRHQAVGQPVAQRGDTRAVAATRRWRRRAMRPPCPRYRRRRGCPDAGRAPGRRRGPPAPRPTPRARRARPTPLGPPNLWALTDTRSATGREFGHVHPPHGGDGVGVQQRRRGERAHQRGHLGQGLDRAHLVVDEHDRHEPDVGAERLGQSVEVDDPVARPPPRRVPPRRRAALSTAWCSTAEHTTVPRPAAGRTEDRQIVRLGTARGEHDLAGLAPEAPGHLVAAPRRPPIRARRASECAPDGLPKCSVR